MGRVRKPREKLRLPVKMCPRRRVLVYRAEAYFGIETAELLWHGWRNIYCNTLWKTHSQCGTSTRKNALLLPHRIGHGVQRRRRFCESHVSRFCAWICEIAREETQKIIFCVRPQNDFIRLVSSKLMLWGASRPPGRPFWPIFWKITPKN